MHTGLGMVRYVGPDRATDFVLARRPEIVAGVGRVQAWLVGSGISAPSLDALDETTRSAFAHASDDGVPVVVDAGAIPLVDLGPLAVLTPHAGELASLLGVSRDEVEGDPRGSALRAAERTGSVVLLKGADTHVVTPDGGVRLVASSATPLARSGWCRGRPRRGARRARRRPRRHVRGGSGGTRAPRSGRGGRARGRCASGLAGRAVPDDLARRAAARGGARPRGHG
ncbi:NAD(P)H-hydrate dehydratase [Curtobacterium sp. MCPF17_052]|uniref:ADP-dependent NAD(P)H-hydrate dehydratase n=1 Tax=Curtobacterium sp. MCPF17_052 TaxID=2175655 RepID=UPI003464AEB0